MLNWDELHITIITPENFLVTEDEKAYSLDAEQRMIVFTGERGLDGEDGKDGKSLNPVGDWSVSNEYKYLDLVYRGGNSYVAKKDVPAGVLVTDTEYWMLSATASGGKTSTLWGEISGSIENQTDLRNELDSLQNELDGLGTMSEVNDAPSDGSEYVRKNGSWTVSSTQWGEISGNIENQTDLQNALDAKANTSSLGNLASKDTADYATDVTNKPSLGTMSEVNDAPSDGSEYVRKNGSWTVSSTQWGEISGNIENQSDLKNALDGKASAIVAKIPTVQSGAYVVVPIDAEIVGYKATYQVSQEGSGTPSASNIRPFISAENAVQVNATNYESTPAGASIRTIALPSPIYGGVVDLHNGTVTVTHGHIASYNGESISGEWYSDRDVYSENTTPTLGAEVVYKLKKPIHMYCDPMPTSRYYTHIWVVRNSSNVMSTEYTVEVAYYLQNSSEGVVDTKTYVDQMNAEKANSDDLGMMAYADDAPSDNVEYVRKNGDWAVSSGGGGGGGSGVWGAITGTLSNQTDLQNALDAKADTSSLGNLATKDTANYATDVTNKPTLGTMSEVNDAPSDGSEYVRKNGAWAVSSGGSGGAGVWGSITGTLSDQTDLQQMLDVKAYQVSIAFPFTENLPYSAGTHYVTYKGRFYSFDGPYQGSWSGLTNKWEITVDELLESLRTTVSQKANTADLGAMASVADAPSDGKKYGRSDGAWTEISEGSAPAWGDITGTLANQTDLNTALSAKADSSAVYTKSEMDTALGAKADATSVYTKTEANALLADKADSADLAGKADASAVYTKTQVDTALSGKADSSAVYSKTEVDTALGAKANSADVTTSLALKADASSVYTKSEVDTALGSKANTADLGDLATKDTVDYLTEIDNIPTAFPPEAHTHDDRYYTESEIDTMLAGYLSTIVDYDGSNLDADTMTNPTALVKLTSSVNTSLYNALGGGYAYVMQLFYLVQGATRNHVQIAYKYNDDTKFAWRVYYNEWRSWHVVDVDHNHDDRYYTESEVDTLLGGKQNTLTFDSTPTASSTNPVTSGGVRSYVDSNLARGRLAGATSYTLSVSSNSMNFLLICTSSQAYMYAGLIYTLSSGNTGHFDIAKGANVDITNGHNQITVTFTTQSSSTTAYYLSIPINGSAIG